MRHLTEPDTRGDIGEVVLAAEHIDLHAVEAATRDALEPVLLGEPGFFLVVEHERAAFDRREILVRMEAE